MIRRVQDEVTNTNFTEIGRVLAELSIAVLGRLTPLTAITTGANVITPTVAKPLARITVYQDAVSSLTDGGLNTAGQWQITASAPCNARFLFF
jgi:hypothetical protein